MLYKERQAHTISVIFSPCKQTQLDLELYIVARTRMKFGVVVLVTAVLAATTVNGHLPLNVQKALERFSSMKTESVGDAGIVATASNGTIESVLSELNMNRR